MENQKIQSFMQSQGGDWIKWVRNPPVTSCKFLKNMENHLMKSQF